MRIIAIGLAGCLLSGCASRRDVTPRWSFDPTRSSGTLTTEPPRDGRILVHILGNARHHGPLWVPENASLATIEELVACDPDLASRTVQVTRVGIDGSWTLEVRINKMSRRDKDQIEVRHGDVISFFWDRCFGDANEPSKRVKLRETVENRWAVVCFFAGARPTSLKRGVNESGGSRSSGLWL